MKLKLFTIIAMIGLILGLQTGCQTVKDGAKLTTEVVEYTISTALETAAMVLSSEGTQALAIAAAQSYITGQIEDPQAAQSLNLVVSQAIPQLANGISNILSQRNHEGIVYSRKSVYGSVCDEYVSSPEFKNIVKECVKNYQELE